MPMGEVRPFLKQNRKTNYLKSSPKLKENEGMCNHKTEKARKETNVREDAKVRSSRVDYVAVTGR